MCDGAGRFNMNDPTKPQWINYTGGDSVWATAATGPAVYVQGHFQLWDNWDGFASRCLPEGHVCASRKGIAALDPDTGFALGWDGNKPAQQGGKSLLVTDNGLWVPSDSLRFHGKPHPATSRYTLRLPLRPIRPLRVEPSLRPQVVTFGGHKAALDVIDVRRR